MPTGPVDNKGTVLYYEDSGALEGAYMTVVLVHAVGFHIGECTYSLTSRRPLTTVRHILTYATLRGQAQHPSRLC